MQGDSGTSGHALTRLGKPAVESRSDVGRCSAATGDSALARRQKEARRFALRWPVHQPLFVQRYVVPGHPLDTKPLFEDPATAPAAEQRDILDGPHCVIRAVDEEPGYAMVDDLRNRAARPSDDRRSAG